MARSVPASAVWTKRSPSRGARPSGRKACSRRAQLRLLRRPVPGHALVYRKAVLGVADRGRKQFVETLGPVRVQQQLPAGNGARNGDRMRRDIVGRSGAAVLIASSEAAAAERPEPLTAMTLPRRRARKDRKVAAEPGRLRLTTPSTAQAATAASTALPPARNISIAVSEAIASRSPPSRSRNRRGCDRSDGSPAWRVLSGRRSASRPVRV